jgi:GT2 family glycosyltransferase
MIRRERLEKIRGFDESLQRSGVDFDFHLRTCREGPVAFADVATIRYRIGGADAMSHPARRVRMAENFIRTIFPIIERESRSDRPAPAHDQRGDGRGRAVPG